VHSASDRLNLRQFRHRFIVVGSGSRATFPVELSESTFCELRVVRIGAGLQAAPLLQDSCPLSIEIRYVHYHHLGT
jgi:hypothetical protein